MPTQLDPPLGTQASELPLATDVSVASTTPKAHNAGTGMAPHVFDKTTLWDEVVEVD